MEAPGNADPQSSRTLLEKSTIHSKYSKRFLVAILGFIGTLFVGALTANLNIAIVDMTSNRTIHLYNETVVEEAEFNWDSKTIGFMLSLCPYGYALSLFGSNLPMKIGASTTITINIVFTAILTILTPATIRYNLYLYIFVRVLVGLCEGLALASFLELWSRWAPVQDRSKLLSISSSGFYACPVVIYPACGFIIHMFGWPAAFYLTGGLSLLWGLLWFICVPNDPMSDKRISKEEQKYITENQVQTKRPKHVMSIWKGILTSKCIWVLCASKFATSLVYNFVIKYLPMYIKDITDAEIHKIGIFSALPNILSIFITPLTGYAVDYSYNKHILTPTQVNKSILCTGFAVGAALLFCISSFRLSFAITISCVVIIKLTLSISYVIQQISCICVAPQCASLVGGTLTACSAVGSIIGPMFVGFVVTDHSLDQWNVCISLTGAILLAGAFPFLLWGSADPQPWSFSSEQDEQS